jgi:Flp pilus assembly protein TadG
VEKLKSQRGQALVEFALILPILLAVMIGIFDFGGAYNQKNNLSFLAN